MSLPLGPVIALYNTLTTPIPFLVSLGLPVSTLDVVGSLRLALVVQQIKLAFKMRAVQQAASEGEDKNGEKVAPSFPTDTALSNIWTMLVIVYGGELFVSTLVLHVNYRSNIADSRPLRHFGYHDLRARTTSSRAKLEVGATSVDI
ncbi:hypothetical protein M407DRAFT_7419 [Tulasnella calospora MUT 4182]|uniref:Uncharacterized protein n=1 Tax=Tulasnella calospora MUT 4182 TaxID=1051891 RepID=A0A0C3M0H9_9AGAM|nr:hypothetical protein M407DRAFT_7419 [Tulasnella calospora MUT 4182]